MNASREFSTEPFRLAMISVIYILCQCFYAVTDRCFVVVINRELGHVVQLQSHQAKYHWAKKAWGGTERDTFILLVSPILYVTKSSTATARKDVALKLTLPPQNGKCLHFIFLFSYICLSIMDEPFILI